MLCMRQPRIELGAQRWQRWILPLNHWHSDIRQMRIAISNTLHLSFISLICF